MYSHTQCTPHCMYGFCSHKIHVVQYGVLAEHLANTQFQILSLHCQNLIVVSSYLPRFLQFPRGKFCFIQFCCILQCLHCFITPSSSTQVSCRLWDELKQCFRHFSLHFIFSNLYLNTVFQMQAISVSLREIFISTCTVYDARMYYKNQNDHVS